MTVETIMPVMKLGATRLAPPAVSLSRPDSVAVCFRTPRNVVQSASLTSCEVNGCGCTGEGGGSTGNPLSKFLPLAIKYVGGKLL